MIYTRGREDLRRNTKSNLLRTFVFLYYTGARLNELQTPKINIQTLAKTRSLMG